jgi:hypothetical protein
MTPGIVVADAGYGVDTQFRRGLSELDLEYVVGVQSSATVWEPGKEPLPAKLSPRSGDALAPYQGTGRPPRLLRRDPKHQPLAVKQLAMTLPFSQSWRSQRFFEWAIAPPIRPLPAATSRQFELAGAFWSRATRSNKCSSHQFPGLDIWSDLRPIDEGTCSQVWVSDAKDCAE